MRKNREDFDLMLSGRPKGAPTTFAITLGLNSSKFL